ncbi:MarR family transcriptional regulator [Streptomyces sp. SL13]|uniref:MarR family transcriptional regulator n=1 Tax=Streptantibioticus silvisoli TaxID=2705255 RepID=A0AA90H0C9_9ACTN|nr:MarR family transcriptional regulator [Streptantibioticus silvisoli]MDI5964400.1 MarR family transcriptional regulator [Streptantibioticus silvisoli]MDI5969046.1 MarR family transcriptional regulator [Streptantibioticus silvisoli]
MADEGGRNRDPAAVEEIAAPVAALTELWARGGAAASPRLSAHQLRALGIVAQEEGTNITGLAEAAGMALSSASRLCDRLEAAGLLERTASPGNRRETALRVTHQGRTLLAAVDDRRRRDLNDVLRRMPPDRVRDLTSGLTAFQDAADPGRDAEQDNAS